MIRYFVAMLVRSKWFIKKLTNHVNGKAFEGELESYVSDVMVERGEESKDRSWFSVFATNILSCGSFAYAMASYDLSLSLQVNSQPAQPFNLDDIPTRQSLFRLLILMATFQLHVKDFQSCTSGNLTALPYRLCWSIRDGIRYGFGREDEVEGIASRHFKS